KPFHSRQKREPTSVRPHRSERLVTRAPGGADGHGEARRREGGPLCPATIYFAQKGDAERPGGVRPGAAAFRIEGHAGDVDAPRRREPEAPCARQRRAEISRGS